MTLQDRIEALATRIANHFRDAIVPKLVPAGGATGQVLAKSSAADHALGWQSPGGGAFGSATVTFAAAGAFYGETTIADARVTPASVIIVSLGSFADNPENDIELMDEPALTATPGAGQITFSVKFPTLESGPIPLVYTIG